MSPCSSTLPRLRIRKLISFYVELATLKVCESGRSGLSHLIVHSFGEMFLHKVVQGCSVSDFEEGPHFLGVFVFCKTHHPRSDSGS